MIFQKMESLDDYVTHLKKTPAEMQALFNDLLINVTSFFRYRGSFKPLRTSYFRNCSKTGPQTPPCEYGCQVVPPAKALAPIAICLLESLGN